MSLVLIIDDEEKIRTLLARIISLEGFEVLQAADARTGLKKLEQSAADVVLCDVKLPDENGVELVKKIKDKSPFSEVILLTAYGNIADGVQAIKNGAFDYITKGDDNNKIIPLLHNAMQKAALTKRVAQLEAQLGRKYSFGNILGKSKLVKAAIDAAEKVAATDAAVLLTGETGTGKEVFAQAIHNAGNRSKQNFIAINCAAFTKDLLENELFGHKAGAFTGALKDAKGIFEEANKGTVFLDEIGEMPLELQAKLLRVLESGEYLKIGDSKPVKTDVRIIAATNRDLLREIESGNFRQDLYYRIAVFTIALPALRERVTDIEELANYFLKLFTAKANKKALTFSKAYIDALKQHHWNGNIRELKNVVERSVILATSAEIESNTLPPEFKQFNTTTGKTLSAFDLASAEKLHIQKVLNYTNGNKTETARLLNIALTTLYRKLDEYKIS
ncbi:sigma-54-dependent Fis family transcriptional regulator [Panacibacter sp. DH6]|uniref:Sigma-54-dependent Fis family transcriptional regulator n=1 Tax=Panacibacter microcysteis TaxID=2793269 RepID=A0A931E8K0_9BACT|nr:sigma-54 dependent transcriptional regulator [Panacibacter microcysteis]MBG9377270.1 sigma-54-dependent Fis family transcriptional regulator [Panacibacter microcysteis]